MRKLVVLVVVLALVLPTGAWALEDQDSLVGEFISYREGYVSLRSEGLTYRIFFLARGRLEIDGRPVKFYDFKPGMPVYLGLKKGYGISMEGYSATRPGQEALGGRSLTGVLKFMDRNQLRVELATGQEETFFVHPGTIFLRQGVKTRLEGLYVGDYLRLSLDSDQTSLLSKVQAQGESVVLKGIYKGKLASVDQLRKKVLLGSLKVFRNNNWEDLDQDLSLDLRDRQVAYRAGEPVDLASLGDFRGQTAYFVLGEDLGQPAIERLVLQDQYENRYSDKIDRINWYTGELELANRQNIGFNPGTIVIKNGRLVDLDSLNPKADALVLTDGRGPDQRAQLIEIYNEDINNSNLGQDQIYSGRLDRVFRDRFRLRDFFILSRNQWESFSRDKELFYDKDSYIFDLDRGRELDPEEFYSGGYGVDEDERYRSRSRDSYGYIYSEGDRASLIFVQEKGDSLLRQRVSTARLESGLEDSIAGRRIRLENMRNWSQDQRQWISQNSSSYLYLEGAMILKDNRPLAPEDLRPGDRLYIVREDKFGKVVIVK